MKHSAHPNAEHWLGQAGLPWNILLVAKLFEVPTIHDLRVRLSHLSRDQGWPVPPPGTVIEGDLERLLSELAAVQDVTHPVSVGRAPEGLVIRAHHALVDGLGLLAVLRELTATDVRSKAIGVGKRPRRSTGPAVATRLLEVVIRPPAGVAPTASWPTEGDVFAAATLNRSVRTSELVHAGVCAIGAWNVSNGARSRRIALAVGVSTLGGEDLRLGEHSGFFRLTNAERLDLQQLERALASVPLQVGGTARSATTRRASGLIRWASRAFAPRLGSTLLVSHLGRVEADQLTEAVFYPLAAGGSGLSLGAVTVSGRTTVSLRARRSEHGPVGLERLLATIVDRLDQEGLRP